MSVHIQICPPLEKLPCVVLPAFTAGCQNAAVCRISCFGSGWKTMMDSAVSVRSRPQIWIIHCTIQFNSGRTGFFWGCLFYFIYFLVTVKKKQFFTALKFTVVSLLKVKILWKNQNVLPHMPCVFKGLGKVVQYLVNSQPGVPLLMSFHPLQALVYSTGDDLSKSHHVNVLPSLRGCHV